MAIATTYSQIIIENIIKQMLSEGLPLTVTEIENRFNTLTKGKDLSIPQSNLTNMKVESFEHASASKWNKTNQDIYDDISIAYQEMQNITSKVLKSSYRWRLDSALIESKLNNLSQRVDNLLRTQNRGAKYYITEGFINALQVDLTNSTAFVDLNNHTVCLSKTEKNSTRINLNKLTESDIQFSVLSRVYLTGLQQAEGSNLLYAFDDTNRFWQSRVTTSSQSKPVVTELKVKLGEVLISKIEFHLHTSNTSNSIQVTPMLSMDGVTYDYLPTEQTTLSVMDRCSWIFPATKACYAKFILTKNGCDISQNNSYIYEFGAEEIIFSCESFTTATTQTLYSDILSVKDIDGLPIKFNKVALEVCERVPDYTDIKYFISVLPAQTSEPQWVPIDHSGKDDPINPSIVKFGDIANLEVSSVGICYNPVGPSGLFINPSANYQLVTVSGNVITSTPSTAAAPRYALINSNDRLLTHELAADVQVITDSVEIFRNVGTKGPVAAALGTVRSIVPGWTFEDPYYCTVVEVNNQNGYVIDFGDKEVVLDGVKVKGKVSFSPGIHYIKVNKTFWLSVNTLDDDKFYPFNHRYLIEGWVDDPIYKGVDRFAGYYMKQVSLIDYLNNIRSDDYSRFAIDSDVSGNKVFVLKCNENLTDFIDETFVIRFDVENQLYNYLKFKAELKTNSSDITPNLDGYRLQLSQ